MALQRVETVLHIAHSTRLNMLARTSLQLLLAIGAFFTLTFLLFGRQLYQSSLTAATPEEYSHEDATPPPQMDMSATHWILRSVSSKDGAFFPIDFGSRSAINPSVIPHPEDNTSWIVTAQLHEPRSGDKPRLWFAELVCSAAFSPSTHDTSTDTSSREALQCTESPLILPIAATPSDASKCPPDTAFFTLSIGPHDARVFHGPKGPYIIYGSTSQLTCFGQWMLDFRLLVDWGVDTINDHGGFLRTPTELQRPLTQPYRAVEKNWFVFWDAEGQGYVHYDIAPSRSFAQLQPDGSVGPDLSPVVAESDDVCLRRLLPTLAPGANSESIHQATNTLSITLCARADPACVPGPDNTFVLTIVQHKSFYRLHSTYEPYAVLFRAVEPFEVYGVSSKPLWISGRRAPPSAASPSPDSLSQQEGGSDAMRSVKLQSEMIYVTSISWKAHGQRYHGFLDDVLFLGFGIEDAATGVIDVLARDLVDGINLCV